MPATYHVIPGNVWTRPFRRLSLEAKVTAFAVYTSPLRLSEGIFELSAGHVAADAGLTAEEVDAALDELQEAGVLRYDAGAELVLIPWALKASPLRHKRDKVTGEIATREDGTPMLDLRIEPAVKKVRNLPASPLKAVFLDLAREHSPDLADALEEALPKPPTEGTGEGAHRGLPGGQGGTRVESRAEQEQEREPREEPSHVGSANGEGEKRCEVCRDLIEAGWCTKPACSPMFARVAGGAS